MKTIIVIWMDGHTESFTCHTWEIKDGAIMLRDERVVTHVIPFEHVRSIQT